MILIKDNPDGFTLGISFSKYNFMNSTSQTLFEAQISFQIKAFLDVIWNSHFSHHKMQVYSCMVPDLPQSNIRSLISEHRHV